MMATHKEYNGWYNYETWLVNLWMENDEGSYSYWRERAQEVYKHAVADSTFTREERAVLVLAEQIKSEHDEAQPETTGLWADMMNAALSEVNWHEIAEHLIDEVEKG
jgi:hypothetical protein